MSHSPRLPWRVRALAPRGTVLGVSVVLLACGGDTTGPTPLSSANAFWALQLNYHAVTMASVAPQNTLRLTAMPLTAAGTPLSGLGAVVYHAADSTVTVDSTGLVTALYRTGGTRQTRVIAMLRDPQRNVTHVDTVFILVTDTLPHSSLATFSIQPVSGDSAKISVDFEAYGNNVMLPVYATDVAGNTVCDANGCPIPVYFTSSDPGIATIDRTSGQIITQHVGHVTFHATALVYGTVVSDSLVYEVGNRIFGLFNQISVQNFSQDPLSASPPHSFAPQTLTIGVGGEVYMLPLIEEKVDTVDIEFSNPNAVIGAVIDGEGNPFDITNSAFLLTTYEDAAVGPPPNDFYGTYGDLFFPHKGTFTYHSQRLGTSGTIIVGD